MKFFLAMTTLLVAALMLTAADNAASGVSYVEKDKVDGFLAKGGTMIKGSDFAVQGTHRVKPGRVEVHVKETDVFYVTDGSATVITGGTVVNPKEGRENQIGGDSIDGGQTFHISKGDVMTIPAGVPHWFKETTGVSYYVVKVNKP